MSLAIFGDSIAHGAFDIKNGGWVELLKKYSWEKNFQETGKYHKGKHFCPYNFSIHGATSKTTLESFDSDIKKPLWGVDKIIFAIGLNDSGFYNEEKRENKKQFQKNIKELMKKSLKVVNSKNIYILGITNVDEEVEKDFTNKRAREFNKILQEIAFENKIKFISLFGILEKENFANGAHPNSEGHSKIFNKVLENILQKK